LSRNPPTGADGGGRRQRRSPPLKTCPTGVDADAALGRAFLDATVRNGAGPQILKSRGGARNLSRVVSATGSLTAAVDFRARIVGCLVTKLGPVVGGEVAGM